MGGKWFLILKNFAEYLRKSSWQLEKQPKKANINESNISRYKLGLNKPSPKNIGKLAKGLDVDIDELVDIP